MLICSSAHVLGSVSHTGGSDSLPWLPVSCQTQFKALTTSCVGNLPLVWELKCLKGCSVQTAQTSTFLEIRTVLLKGGMLRDVLFNYIKTILAPCTNILRVLHSTTSIPCFTSQLEKIWNWSLIQYQGWLAKHETAYQFLEDKNKWTNTTRSYLTTAETSLNQTTHPEQHSHQKTQKCHDLWIYMTLCMGCKTDSQNVLQD